MKQWRVFLSLTILVLASFAFLSTLARYTSEYSGSDAILVAKWNFGARGEEDIEGEFYNKGFTFDLFDAHNVKPMDYGEKNFTFTGGGSDVGIVYDVEMNVQDLLQLAQGTVAQTPGVDIYAPFIFKITAAINEGAADEAPVVFSPPGSDEDGWFRPGDIETDEDGFFSIFDTTDGEPFFTPGSEDKVTVTVYWQWNVSCFINDTEVAAVNPPIVPDTSTDSSGVYLPYYQTAYDQYYGPGGLDEQRRNAAQAVADFLAVHGSPADDGTWIHYLSYQLPHRGQSREEEEQQPGPPEPAGHPEGQGSQPEPDGGDAGGGDTGGGDSGGDDGGTLCPVDHYAEYNYLVGLEHAAITACEASLMAAYDDYDTLAIDALVAKETVKVIFRIKGDQMMPGQNIPPTEPEQNSGD